MHNQSAIGLGRYEMLFTMLQCTLHSAATLWTNYCSLRIMCINSLFVLNVQKHTNVSKFSTRERGISYVLLQYVLYINVVLVRQTGTMICNRIDRLSNTNQFTFVEFAAYNERNQHSIRATGEQVHLEDDPSSFRFFSSIFLVQPFIELNIQ